MKATTLIVGAFLAFAATTVVALATSDNPASTAAGPPDAATAYQTDIFGEIGSAGSIACAAGTSGVPTIVVPAADQSASNSMTLTHASVDQNVNAANHELCTWQLPTQETTSGVPDTVYGALMSPGDGRTRFASPLFKREIASDVPTIVDDAGHAYLT